MVKEGDVKMNVSIDPKNRVSINNTCIGKMDSLPFTELEVKKDRVRCFIQIMDWVIEKHLQETTTVYLLKRIGSRRTPEFFSFWIDGEKIFDNGKLFDCSTPVVQLLLVAMDFATEFINQQDRMWLILSNIETADFGVERKIEVLNSQLKKFVLEHRDKNGFSSTDFHTVILPCFKAIIRDLMGAEKR